MPYCEGDFIFRIGLWWKDPKKDLTIEYIRLKFVYNLKQYGLELRSPNKKCKTIQILTKESYAKCQIINLLDDGSIIDDSKIVFETNFEFFKHSNYNLDYLSKKIETVRLLK